MLQRKKYFRFSRSRPYSRCGKLRFACFHIFVVVIVLARLQAIRPPMPPIQYPIRAPPPPTNANVIVPTNPPTEHNNGPRHTGPRLGGHSAPSTDEHHSSLAQPQITNPPAVPLQQYTGLLLLNCIKK